MRRQVPARAASSPERLAAAWDRTLAEITRRLLPVRRLRAFPRVVKRKMSNWGLKRAHHRTWPQPAAPPADAVTMRPASKAAPTKRKPKATA
ncbi:hypothetical protein [Streptomyces mirabilis]|uniref:hypothetical protein n=1 Tax=Streptomyces mirabilis TaxID=68239 RepID=UPI0033BE7C19